jgi:hypothetical protein
MRRALIAALSGLVATAAAGSRKETSTSVPPEHQEAPAAGTAPADARGAGGH